MINQDNYYKVIANIDMNAMSNAIQKGHDFVNQSTENGTNWDMYYQSATIKNVIDKYFSILENQLSNQEVPKTPISVEKESAIKVVNPPAQKVKKSVLPKQVIQKIVDKVHTENVSKDLIERMPEEIRFMKRYIKMDNQSISQKQMLKLVNDLQKSILEKRIRKTSPYATQIKYMQDKLLKVYNQMDAIALVKIDAKIINEFENLIESSNIFPSIRFIKRYLNLNGKENIKAKADLLSKQIKKAVSNNKILSTDKYAKVLNKIWNNLNQFIESPNETKLKIESAELNGLNGLLEACNCHNLNGVEEDWGNEDLKTEAYKAPVFQTPNTTSHIALMNSMEFANLKFNTLGLTGKWLKLIGDPSKQFTAMVFGKPKMGKSYLCMDFAGYLARNHGNVLYIAKEEGLDHTLQMKMNDKDVKHPNLTFADGLPDDLSPYQFIFFDSVNKLNLNAQDLELIEREYPQCSMIYIFQTTKLGNFRGANENQHNVDIVIEVPEKGKAIQYGRYNQGGEINIFP